MKRAKLIVIIFLLVFLMAGCNLPKASEPTAVDEGAIRTSVAQTLAAQIEAGTSEPAEVAQDTEVPPPSDTPEPTSTDTIPPTETLTFTPSLTPSFTPSPTSSVPMVSVSLDTNCRTGPGLVYDQIGVLLVGESAVIVAQEQTGDYWIIENPDRAGTCWLWAEYATITGNVSGLPLLTPPASPTPTPSNTPSISFKVTYENYHNCGITPHMTFKVVNNGSIVLESADIGVVEVATLTALFDGYTDVPFVSTPNGCPMELQYLSPSNTAYIAVPLAAVPNSGSHSASFRICSADGLGGLCLTKEINFDIP
jgi:hypothetical protein